MTGLEHQEDREGLRQQKAGEQMSRLAQKEVVGGARGKKGQASYRRSNDPDMKGISTTELYPMEVLMKSSYLSSKTSFLINKFDYRFCSGYMLLIY